MRPILDQEEHARIAEAIRQAETRTAGEIHCVLARSSDEYVYPALVVISVAVMAASLIAALVVERMWLPIDLLPFLAAQIAAWLAGAALVCFVPSLRIRLVPRRLAYRRAHDNAARQFLARNIHLTEARTGVLVFVSLAERYAEIVADRGIDRHVEPEVWDEAVALLIDHARRGALAEGFVSTIALVGQVLARHVPPGGAGANPNELDDHLVEL